LHKVGGYIFEILCFCTPVSKQFCLLKYHYNYTQTLIILYAV